MNIDEIFNGQYIYSEQLMTILDKISEYEEKIKLLKTVKEYNYKLYQKEVEREKELTVIAKLQTEEISASYSTKTNVISNDKKIILFQDEEKIDVSSYYHQLKESQTKENFISVLKEIKDEETIKQVLLLFYRELVLINNIKYDKDVAYTPDEISYIEEEIQIIREQFETIKKYITTKQDVPQPIKEKATVIYLKTESGNVCALSDAKSIPREYYESFNELLDSILNCEFKNNKFLSNNSGFVDGLQEVKNFKTRIIYKNVADNTYAILGMFIKKATNDKYNYEFMKQRSSLYIKQEKNILNILKDNDAINKEQESTKSIKEIFRCSKKEEGEEYGRIIK